MIAIEDRVRRRICYGGFTISYVGGVQSLFNAMPGNDINM